MRLKAGDNHGWSVTGLDVYDPDKLLAGYVAGDVLLDALREAADQDVGRIRGVRRDERPRLRAEGMPLRQRGRSGTRDTSCS